MIKPLPCPCCGNANLYFGHISAFSMGVACQAPDDDDVRILALTKKLTPEILETNFKGCGLRMVHEIPGRFPEEMPNGLTAGEKIEWLEEYILDLSVKLWNRRV